MAKDKIVLVKYNDDSESLDLNKGPETKETSSAESKRETSERTEARRKGAPSPEPEYSFLDSPGVESETLKKLRAAVNGGNSALTQFKNMLASLEDVIPDKATRQVAALRAVAQSFKITPAHILSAIETRTRALQTESKRISDGLDQGKSDLSRYRNQLREKDQAIEKLRNQISALEDEKSAIEAKVAKREASNRAASSELSEAIEILRREIERENEAIIKFLKAG